MTRNAFLRVLIVAATSLLMNELNAAPESPACAPDFFSIPVRTIDGQDTTLAPYLGKVLLIVNVASECGYTVQYEGLEKIYRKYKDRGLVVLGFPCNDFGGQEPGTETEIQRFCTSRYQVSFPLFSKITTQGPNAHKLFEALTGEPAGFPGKIKWNFNKFLIGRDGQLAARFGSGIEPESAEITGAVEAALAK